MERREAVNLYKIILSWRETDEDYTRKIIRWLKSSHCNMRTGTIAFV